VIVACFARALRGCTGSASIRFLSIRQEVRVICKLATRYIFERHMERLVDIADSMPERFERRQLLGVRRTGPR
jgi:hypothetical protein